MISDANTKAVDTELSSCHVQPGFSVVRHIHCIVNDLRKPDLLYTMQIGMLDHLQMWIFHCRRLHEPLQKYNAIWLSVAVYHYHTPKYTTYEEVAEWNGKEMKEMSWYLLGVVTQSLWGGNPAQRPIFNHPFECTEELLEFHM